MHKLSWEALIARFAPTLVAGEGCQMHFVKKRLFCQKCQI